MSSPRPYPGSSSHGSVHSRTEILQLVFLVISRLQTWESATKNFMRSWMIPIQWKQCKHGRLGIKSKINGALVAMVRPGKVNRSFTLRLQRLFVFKVAWLSFLKCGVNLMDCRLIWEYVLMSQDLITGGTAGQRLGCFRPNTEGHSRKDGRFLISPFTQTSGP